MRESMVAQGFSDPPAVQSFHFHARSERPA